jgi:hypothetical protein
MIVKGFGFCEAISCEIDAFYGDGAYDNWDNHDELQEREIDAIIPPRRGTSEPVCHATIIVELRNKAEGNYHGKESACLSWQASKKICVWLQWILLESEGATQWYARKKKPVVVNHF